MSATPVQKELSRIARDYQRFELFKRLGWVLGIHLAIGLGLFGLERAFWIAVPYSPRLLAISAFLCSVIAWMRVERRSIGLREIAQKVEQSDPKLNSLLLAAAEQSPDSESHRLNFLQQKVMLEALEANRRSPWMQRFVERLFYAQCAAIGCFVFFLVTLMALGATHPTVIRQRAIARTAFKVSPGDAEVERGSTVAILAEFPAREVPTKATLVIQPATGIQKSISLDKSLQDPLFGTTLPDIKDDFTYHVEFDNGRSRDFKVSVFDYPELKRADAELHYPDYTSLPSQKIADTRHISAVEGTSVHYTFSLNKAVQRAELRAKDGKTITLTNNPAQPALYATGFDLMESKNYELRLVDEKGRTNKVPPEFVFAALKNERPKLKLQSPRGDQRVSALQELRFDGQAEDDFGLKDYGVAFAVTGGETAYISLAKTEAPAAAMTNKLAPRGFKHVLPLESLHLEPDQVVSYFAWADDLGPDGKTRRTAGDMYFAEVRPFEEIFREGQGDDSNSSQQQGGQNGSPSQKLTELQKQIISATWNLKRNQSGANNKFKEDAGTIRDSQREALTQAGELVEKLQDEKAKALARGAESEMEKALDNLSSAAKKPAVEPLDPALSAEQSAYQSLLKLQGREYQVRRSRQRGGGQSSGQQRAQRQLDQLELKQQENRYEKESEAAPAQSKEQHEALQVLNRLKELARRQQDMSERLKELQTALNEAKTEEEREALRRQLKRLQEEQQQIVQDMDELRQRMDQPENRSKMNEAKQQVEQTRNQSREAADQLQQGNVPKALSSSTRAQRDLQKLADDFRKSTSNQFSDDMRQLRQQSRELQQKEQQLGQKLDDLKQTQQKTLSDNGERKGVLDALAQQKSGLTNVTEKIKQVTQAAEVAEPVLSRQLYETLRKTAQANPDKALDLSSQLLERNFLPQATEAEHKAAQAINDLNDAVQRAASSVLGDETEALRHARAELEDLANRVEREMAAQNSTNGVAGAADPNSTNRVAAASSQGNGTNATAAAASGRLGTNALAQASGKNGQPGQGQSGEQNGKQEGQQDQNGSQGKQGDQSGKDGQAQAGSQSKEEGKQGQQGQGKGEGQGQGAQQLASNESQQQEGQNGQQGGQGQGRGNRNSAQEQQRQQQGARGQRGQGQSQQGQGQQGEGQGQGQGQGQQQTAQNTPGQRNGNRQGGRRSFADNWAGSEGGAGDGGAEYFDGPLTGANYAQWSDRLRDVEEMLDDPNLRNEVARVRDRAREARMEFKKRELRPRKDLVFNDIINPLRVLQTRVSEELARRESKEAVVPVDRDPVPKRYTDLVSRYYENLGKEPVAAPKK